MRQSFSFPLRGAGMDFLFPGTVPFSAWTYLTCAQMYRSIIPESVPNLSLSLCHYLYQKRHSCVSTPCIPSKKGVTSNRLPDLERGGALWGSGKRVCAEGCRPSATVFRLRPGRPERLKSMFLRRGVSVCVMDPGTYLPSSRRIGVQAWIEVLHARRSG